MGDGLRERLLLLGLVLLLAIPLVFVLRGGVREAIVVPVLYILWLGRLFLQSVPQSLLWALFLMVGLVVAVRSFRAARGSTQHSIPPRRVRGGAYSGPVWTWQRRIHLVARGSYYEWYLAQHLGRLAQEVLVTRERLAPGQIKLHHLFSDGGLDAPPEVRAYLEAGLGSLPPRSVRFPRLARLLRRFRPPAQASPLDLDPERVVQFLERQLEVGRQLEDGYD